MNFVISSNSFYFLFHYFFSLPYLTRIKQCSNEIFKVTDKNLKISHGLNSIKYILLLTSSFLLSSPNYGVVTLIFAIFSGCFAAYWDIFIDWGLNQKHMEKKIGPVLVIVCILNVIIRLIFILFPKFYALNTIFNDKFVLNGLEVFRRTLWTHLRISNHLRSQEQQ